MIVRSSHTALWWLFQKWQECCMAPWFCQQKKPTFTLATFAILPFEQTKLWKAQCFGGCLSSHCLEDLSQDLGPQQRGERRLLPAHQQRDGGNLIGSPVYTQLCVWWIEISLSNQSNLWYFFVYINKTVQKIAKLSFNIYVWFHLNLHRILKSGITLPYWSLFHLIWV